MNEKLSILLVEDNVLNQRIVTFSLKKYNHSVQIANNGLEALEVFKSNKFDVILMDIMMPVMDGLEATLKIREYEEQNNILDKTPIIAVTANTMDNDREKCLSYGMNEFMAKPFDVEKLAVIFSELRINSA
ncbi:response regulator [Mangrovibacterium diazotrophicum]|uniref:Response regulator receiver domain-containing protein n=1 Tax=Mangrovibacterium diazotrophicum TaxID=1261403 RepID=A0A419WA36_9BACT|nr:response regulator [Mangrovibacterium diazotrophicum]RKD92276.1 response regulator receiver domain-containing protein [Mangrovibacterium diazotrophicum]